jgi:hypothetical protein
MACAMPLAILSMLFSGVYFVAGFLGHSYRLAALMGLMVLVVPILGLTCAILAIVFGGRPRNISILMISIFGICLNTIVPMMVMLAIGFTLWSLAAPSRRSLAPPPVPNTRVIIIRPTHVPFPPPYIPPPPPRPFPAHHR